MEFTFDLLQQLGNACLQLVGQPFYYIGILFVVLLYRRQMHLERKMFNTKLHSVIHQTWKSLLIALLAGFVISLVMTLIGAVVQANVIVWIWIIALLLVLFRARFFCFAYSVGIIGILHSLVTFFSFETNLQIVEDFVQALQQLSISSLLALVAIIHILEFMLTKYSKNIFPVVLGGKRGRLVGGFQIQGFWAVPLFLMVPVDSGNGLSLPWTPLLGGEVWAGGWMLLAFPIVMGYSAITKSSLPKEKAQQSSGLILLYGLILLAVAFGVYYLPLLSDQSGLLTTVTLVASLLCIVLHEAIGWVSRWKDNQQSAAFIHDSRGLLVLGTISGSPAEELGIEAGEIIRQVNGMKVLNRKELHQAFNLNSAFCKLEVINLEGHSKFLKRAIFSGEHHQLGLVFAPDQDTEYYIKMKDSSILTYLGMNSKDLFKHNSSPPASAETPPSSTKGM